MNEEQEKKNVDSLREMLATAISLGMICSNNLIAGSILDEKRKDIVVKMEDLYHSISAFLAVSGIEVSADEALPVFKELVSQLSTGEK